MCRIPFFLRLPQHFRYLVNNAAHILRNIQFSPWHGLIGLHLSFQVFYYFSCILWGFNILYTLYRFTEPLNGLLCELCFCFQLFGRVQLFELGFYFFLAFPDYVLYFCKVVLNVFALEYHIIIRNKFCISEPVHLRFKIPERLPEVCYSVSLEHLPDRAAHFFQHPFELVHRLDSWRIGDKSRPDCVFKIISELGGPLFKAVHGRLHAGCTFFKPLGVHRIIDFNFLLRCFPDFCGCFVRCFAKIGEGLL